MRLSIVYDDRGSILAAAVVGEGADQPVPESGERAAEFDVPDELADMELLELLQRLQVDVMANRLTQRS